MTHDPLCPYRPDIATDFMSWERGIDCQCVFIAKVRNDERDQALSRMHRAIRVIEKTPSEMALCRFIADAISPD